MDEFGSGNGEKYEYDEEPDEQVREQWISRLIGICCLPESEFEGTGEPGKGGEAKHSGVKNWVCPDGDSVGGVTAFETPDVLFDEEFIDERLPVCEIAGDVPRSDDRRQKESAGCPIFCPVRAALGQTPECKYTDESKKHKGDRALGKDGETKGDRGDQAKLLIALNAVVESCKSDGETEHEGGIGHHHSADADNEE